ncbi:Zn(2)-C6 fungal-type DNA-binding domain [Penicillium roqueforti FM164]|uniref:Zn(2)-C6 fungal-type DNA-binding domain n=1 Tax=Penicillium roqueforti (strain FM164) TaxID=1365484 RepID=W6R9B1_PENRF|nr:Zn(2)-C6 fungal-type DNA-binding domain [Penicillium roqueforti FM164]
MSARSPATKTACDGCKIRKIRCRDGHPCQGCRNSRIKCTYLRAQKPRGPQRLRFATQYLIDQVQREVAAQPSQDPILSSESQGTGITSQVPAVGRSNDL